MAFIDETGHRYGKLVVLERDLEKSTKNAYWKCQCDCGNITTVLGTKLRKGETKSCGCLRKQSKNVVDMLGQKFGHLTVVERAGSSATGLAEWLCKCDCGNPNLIKTTGSNLRSGHTTSCGCVHKITMQQIKSSDISGQRFGKLVAIKRLEEKRGTNSVWLCQCDCGNTYKADINSLSQGKTSSCGCLTISKGELYISNLLTEANIPFEREKSFESCRLSSTGKKARFDFYVNNHYLIEFDGVQHFIEWDRGKETLADRQLRDQEKNEWCKINNIPLIRIPYTKLSTLTLEDLILETSNFIYKGD